MTDAPVTFSVQLSSADISANLFYATSLSGWRGWILRHGFFIVLAIGLCLVAATGYWLYCVVRQSGPALAGYLMGVLATLCLGFAAVLVFNFFADRLRRAVFRREPHRTMSVSAEGIVEEWGASRIVLSWSDVIALNVWAKRLAIVFGEGRAIIVPLQVQADGTVDEDLVQRLRAWRDAAQ